MPNNGEQGKQVGQEQGLLPRNCFLEGATVWPRPNIPVTRGNYVKTWLKNRKAQFKLPDNSSYCFEQVAHFNREYGTLKQVFPQ